MLLQQRLITDPSAQAASAGVSMHDTVLELP